MGFETMYIGSTGLKSHALGMKNVGNNLANVNTLAYKRGVVHFEDLLSERLLTDSSATNISQSGKGVRVSAVLTDFKEGALHSTTEATDLAISGKGFFQVINGDKIHYTRAGNFRFDKNGYLIDPNSFRLQGKPITDGVAGSTGDIRLTPGEDSYFTTDPEPTSAISMVVNLGSGGDNSTDKNDPFFALAKSWDGRNTSPLGEAKYAFTSQIKVYDESGNAHTLSVYFDKVTPDNGSSGNQYWEYAVGIDPTKDGRATLGSNGSPTEKGAGLLMFGTMTFSSTGTLRNQTAYTQGAAASGVSTNLANWSLADLSSKGIPQFSALFRNSSGVSGEQSTISLDFGARSTQGWSTNIGNTAANVGASNASNLPGLTQVSKGPKVITAFGGSNSTQYISQDGSPMGYLKSLFVDKEGVLSARYTNDTEKELYQIPLYKFTSQDGLKREGMNHFSATKESGEALEGLAQKDGLGKIAPHALEHSNVDMATEFTHMIITQRGFQSNTKVIKTADEMLQKAINLKR